MVEQVFDMKDYATIEQRERAAAIWHDFLFQTGQKGRALYAPAGPTEPSYTWPAPTTPIYHVITTPIYTTNTTNVTTTVPFTTSGSYYVEAR